MCKRARAVRRDGFIPMDDAVAGFSRHMSTPVAREHLATVARNDLKGRFDVLAKGFNLLCAIRARRGDSQEGKELPVAYGPALTLADPPQRTKRAVLVGVQCDGLQRAYQDVKIDERDGDWKGVIIIHAGRAPR